MDLTNKNQPILLIGGTGRSGTTVLRTLIERHRDVASVPEWRFISDPDGLLEFLKVTELENPFCNDQAHRRLESLFRDISRSSFGSRAMMRFMPLLEQASPWRLTARAHGTVGPRVLPNFSELSENFLNDLVRFKWSGHYAGMRRWQKKSEVRYLVSYEKILSLTQGFLQDIAVSAMNDQNKRRFLEKNTWNILHAEMLFELYPNSKLVHIFRDPRDVLASFLVQPWMPSDPVSSAIILRDLYSSWWKQKAAVDNQRVLEISLHELINDTCQTVDRLCDFWELPPDEAMLSQDLSRSNAGRWKDEIPAELIDEVTHILSEPIDRYGV